MDIGHELERSPAMQRGNYNKRCAIIAAATAVVGADNVESDPQPNMGSGDPRESDTMQTVMSLLGV